MPDREPAHSALPAPSWPDEVRLPPGEGRRISDLLRRLGPHSPVRIAAETLLSGVGLRPDQVESLFSALTRTSFLRETERVVAAWCLGRAPLTELEREAAAGTLLRLVDGSPSDRWRSYRRARILYAMLLPVALSIDIAYNPGPILASNWTLAMVPVLWWKKRSARMLRCESAAALGHLQAPETIGVLAQAASDRDPHLRDAAAAALHEALPALTWEHSGLLNAEGVRGLAALLRHADNLLVFKALDALEKVGTGAVIPAVEALRDRARIARMQQRSEEVLAVLRERQRQEKQGKTLLRATTSPDAPSEILVRPAQSAEETRPELLLRPLE